MRTIIETCRIVTRSERDRCNIGMACSFLFFSFKEANAAFVTKTGALQSSHFSLLPLSFTKPFFAHQACFYVFCGRTKYTQNTFLSAGRCFIPLTKKCVFDFMHELSTLVRTRFSLEFFVASSANGSISQSSSSTICLISCKTLDIG